MTKINPLNIMMHFYNMKGFIGQISKSSVYFFFHTCNVNENRRPDSLLNAFIKVNSDTPLGATLPDMRHYHLISLIMLTWSTYLLSSNYQLNAFSLWKREREKKNQLTCHMTCIRWEKWKELIHHVNVNRLCTKEYGHDL